MKIKVKMLTKFLTIVMLTGASVFLFIPKTIAAPELVKSVDFDTVYYIDAEGLRHPFPNRTTFQSWYQNDFSSVVNVSNDFLAGFKLGKNITIRPGTFLVKVPTASEVYAIEQGGVLREIENENIAEAIYGDNWSDRVVDLPEVFFKDYAIGTTIKHDYSLPDEILFKEKDKEVYFYKSKQVLTKFSSAKDVIANKFNLDHAIESTRSFFVRHRPIVGFDKNIFNPVSPVLSDQRDCRNKDLSAAVIFVTKNNYTQDQIGKVQEIKKNIPARFSWATKEFSSINLDHPTAVMFDDGYLLRSKADGTTEVENELINSFYDTNPDTFDFIIVFTNFATPSDNTNEIASFIPVTNKLEGVNKTLLDRSAIYGSAGRLKGIIMMGDIAKYNTSSPKDLNFALNITMHEFLHQWSAYVPFIDETGQSNFSLLRNDNHKQHWSNYAGFISPVGGLGYYDNSNGTFTSELSRAVDSSLRQFSDLDLYLMGLIPYRFMDPITYVEPTSPGASGNTIEGSLKTVTVDQIIAANGHVKCSID